MDTHKIYSGIQGIRDNISGCLYGDCHELLALNVFKVGCQDLKNNQGSIGTLGKSHKPYETTEKMKMAKQATTKTSFLTLSGSKISIVVTAILPQNEVDFDTNDLNSFFYL